MKTIIIGMILGILFFGSARGDGSEASRQEVTLPASSDLEPIDIEAGSELLLFADIPIVVTASRQAQPINWSSSAMSVIEAEDIHYSGVTTLAEILMFSPGMDVLWVDRMHPMVGVRGLHDMWSDRTLMLIDGRPVYSAIHGGMEPFRHPLLMEDIKRIEIVRGPGGAAWGANAFSGVINIITKYPQDTPGWFGSTSWTYYGDSYNHWRWSAKAGKLEWLISTGYADLKSSDDATNGQGDLVVDPGPKSMLGYNGLSAHDFSRTWRFNGRAIYHISPETKGTFDFRYCNLEGGDFEMLGSRPGKNRRTETAHFAGRIDHTFSDDSKGFLQWYGNFEESDDPSIMDAFAGVNQLDSQYDFTYNEKHKVSVGGSFRWMRNTVDYEPGDFTMRGEPRDTYMGGLFLIDHLDVTDRLVLESQVRADWYSETQTDWAGRLSAMYSLDELKHHVLRLSTARAFRTPMYQIRKPWQQRFPLPEPYFPPDSYMVNLFSREDLKNEYTWSFEGGYNGQLTNWLDVRLDGYYQRYEHLIGWNMMDDPIDLGMDRVFSFPDDMGGADAYGGELEVAIKGKLGKLSGWYAYNGFNPPDDTQKKIRALLPAEHKIGGTWRIELFDGWIFNTNYKYSARTEGIYNNTAIESDLVGNGDPFHRWDLTLSRTFFKDNAEIMLGVTNVLQDQQAPIAGSGQFAAHATPGRTFFTRLQIKF